MKGDNRAIAVFDSGVGGLTVLKEIKQLLPNEKIIYFGDTKRVPYGIKDKETIVQHSKQIVSFLTTHNIKLIVIACNSISAYVLEIFNKEFNIPFIEVISNGVEDALLTTKNNKVGIIATEATVRSNIYEKSLEIGNPCVEAFSKACTLFVPLVEEGWVNNEVSSSVASIYLQDIMSKDIDTLILGCTHYPLLYKSIKKVTGPYINIVNPALATSKKVKQYLTNHNALNFEVINSKNSYEFYVSGNTQKFNSLCYKFIGYKCNATKIDIEAY